MPRYGDDSSATLAPVPEWVRAARTAGLLARVGDDVVWDVIHGAHRKEYRPGAIDLRWDEEPMAAIVLRGSGRSFLAYQDGSQVTTRYIKPGDLTGVFAPRQPRIARGVQALEPSELLLISGQRMRQLSLAHPSFGWAVIEEMTTSLNATHRALYLWAFGSVRQRVANAIVERARLGGPLAAGQSVVGTQAELAATAGTVREVVATALQGFKREGIVEVRRGLIVVVDPARLEAVAEGEL